MRNIRYLAFLLVGLVAVLAGTGPGLTQPGPGGRGGFDPSKIFDRYATGPDVVDVAKVPEATWERSRRMDPQAKENMLAFLEKKGVKNGQFTRALFSEYMEGRMAAFRAKKGGGPPPAPVVPGAPGAAPPAAAPPGAAPSPAAEAKMLEDAKNWFNSMDKNKDGVLDKEEVGRSRIARDWDRWDKNKDGKIQFDEYLEYFKDQQARRAQNNWGPGGGQPEPPPVEEEKRPTVYRIGNMPKELPTWFAELDSDKDGQVGLYEWKAKGRPVTEFLAMDLNGDGFITVEEMLRYQKAQAPKDGATASTPGSSPGQPSLRPGPGGGRPAWGGMGKGKGGRGKRDE